MNQKPQIKLSETVVLIDAVYLNFVVADMKKHFEQVLGRSLPDMDVSTLLTCLTLDAGMTEGNHEIQTLFVYDKSTPQLVHAHPSDLEKELNGVAFRCSLGEYAFASVPSEGMVSRDALFFDLLSIVSDSADVKRIIVVGFTEEYGEDLRSALQKIKGKEVIQFFMGMPDEQATFAQCVLAYPLMQAMGIRGDEL